VTVDRTSRAHPTAYTTGKNAATKTSFLILILTQTTRAK
jgi:hypothetical protein